MTRAISTFLARAASNFLRRAISALLPRIRDDAREGRRRRDGGRREIHVCARIPHPPLEVPVRRRDRRLAVAERTLVDAEARAAARVHDDGAGGHEVAEVAETHRLGIDLR